jgi:ABC-type uncharacterized transport system substrate-binding protein
MEGKGCLFKKFAGIDVFDIELAEKDPDKLVEIIAALEPTLGGINLEDIKAPECFTIERKLRERLKIPVFHDDQHGTAIISGAALLNALELVGKRLELIKDMAPRSKRVAILFNPMHPGEKAERQASLSAAEQLGLEVLFTEFDPAQGFEAALDKIRKQRCDALVVFPDAGMLARAAQIAEFGLKERLMCVSGWAEFSHAGCIASYGPNLREGYRRLAHYADRILRGAHPSSLPVELPTRVEMVLNLKTAKAMGITIPQSLLLRADEVIQ